MGRQYIYQNTVFGKWIPLDRKAMFGIPLAMSDNEDVEVSVGGRGEIFTTSVIPNEAWKQKPRVTMTVD